MAKTWIHAQTGGIPYDDPLEIASGDTNIDCVGWWKANDFSQGQGGRGDQKQHVYTWNDSSPSNNDLLGGVSGPVLFSGDGNHEGSSSDELNGFAVLDFTNDQSANGTGTSDYYLTCNPSTDADFNMGGTDNPYANFMNIIAIGRHHVVTSDSNFSSGDWQMLMATDSYVTTNSDTWAYGLKFMQGVVGTTNFAQNVSYKDDEDYVDYLNGGASDSLVAGTWYAMGMFGSSYTGSPTYGKTAVLKRDGSGDLINESPNTADTVVGVGQGNNTFLYVGRNKGTPASNLHGRVAEIAMWKSSAPFSTAQREEAVNFFKYKFNL